MGEFPSGQRGQTVNLLLLASVVRIHLLPPKSSQTFAGFFCFIDKFRGAYDMIRENQVVAKL